MRIDFTALTDEVTAQETVEAGAIQVVNALLDEVQANRDAPAALDALVARGRASTAALAAAIAAVPTGGGGTPTAPPAQQP